MAVGAYPYASWPRVRRGDAVVLRRMLRGLPAIEGSVLLEAQTLLGASVTLASLPAELCDAQAVLSADPAALVLHLEPGTGTQTQPVLCELSAQLAALLVDRTLGGDGKAVHLPGDNLDALSTGVLGYLAARLLAAAGADLRLCAVLQAAEARAVIGAHAKLLWPLRVSLDGQAVGHVRVLLSEDALAATARSARSLPAHLRALPLRVCAHVARVSLLQRELTMLAIGDVVVPARCTLARDRHGFHGEAMLHACGTARDAFRCEARGSELVLRTLETEGGIAMTQAKRIDTQSMHTDAGALALAGDAPVELCLQLARFTMTLAELSALRAGEVLGTGRAIGERVTLSAAGRAVAYGELVDIDGEVGLRVLELVGAAADNLSSTM